MFIEQAVVIKYENGIVEAECQSQQSCGGCAAKASCGAASLGEINGERSSLRFKIPTDEPYQIGQRINLGLKESSVLLSALLLYSLPLFVLMLTTIIGGIWIGNELLLTLLIVIMTGLTLWGVKLITPRFTHHKKYQPVILKSIL